MKKGLLLLVILALLTGFFVFDLHTLFTLEQAKTQVDRWQTTVAEAPLLASLIYFIAYVLVTALSLPGAVLMTLAGGALFGFGWGLVLISFASSVGATLAFLSARFLLADTVEKRVGNRLTAFHQGIEREGAFYLFTLRLVPIVPFFLINLGMGLTRIRAWTFYWVSQIGMLAGTAVYVNAGTQLAQIDSLKGIVSPGLLLSFVLLGLFPLVAKKLIALIKGRQVYAGFKRPAHFDRNLIVIGGGAGGLVSAYIGAVVKAKVTLVEANKMGGDCLNYGCVPSKALIKSAKVLRGIQQAERYGLELAEAQKSQVNFPALMARVRQVIKDIEPHDSVERYQGLGVDVVQGYAKLIDPWTVEIQRRDGGVQRLTSRAIILATGASPVIPKIEGLDQVAYLTSETLWDRLSTLREIPKRMAILGGGPIGCELAQALATLGTQVTLIERSSSVLSREDNDVQAAAMASLQEVGVTVLTQAQVMEVGQENNQIELRVQRLQQPINKQTVNKQTIKKQTVRKHTVIEHTFK